MRAGEERLRFRATLAGFEEAARELRDRLDGRALPDNVRYNVELAFEEVVTNIVRHGKATGDIEVGVRFDDHEVILAFEDDGVRFDPRNRPARVAPSSLDDADIGGLGLHLLATIVTRIDYQRTPEQRNRLTIAIPRR